MLIVFLGFLISLEFFVVESFVVPNVQHPAKNDRFVWNDRCCLVSIQRWYVHCGNNQGCTCVTRESKKQHRGWAINSVSSRAVAVVLHVHQTADNRPQTTDNRELTATESLQLLHRPN